MTSTDGPVPDAATTTAPDPAAGESRNRRSAALSGRERIVPTRPDWAAAAIPAHRKPLPILTRDARRPGGYDGYPRTTVGQEPGTKRLRVATRNRRPA